MADLLHPQVADEDEVQEAPEDPGEFEVAGTADDALEADLLWRALEDAGIPAIVRSPRSDMAGKLDAPVDLFSLLVPVRDLARARSLLEEQRAALESDPEGAARAAEEEESAGEEGGEPH
jgi:Putative prokaryotic signal transducing protein